MADVMDRTVHISNFSLTKDVVHTALKENFGPCFVKDPFKPRTEGQKPFGFVKFDSEKDAQACLTARRLVISGVSMGFAPSKRPSNSSSGGGGAQNQNNTNTSSFSFGNVSNTGANSIANTRAAPEKKKCFKAILSHSVGLDELYIQNVSDNRAMEYLQLQEELSIHCQTAADVSVPQGGQIYAGLFSEDNAWYRCKLVTTKPGEKYLVQFIDYGNMSIVSNSGMKQLTENMQTKPAAAVKCHIKDLIVKPGCEEKVSTMIASWQEILLECEYSSDGSVDLYNKEKDVTLRHLLINSECVTGAGNLQHNNHNSAVSSDTESVGSQKGKKNNKQNGRATPQKNQPQQGNRSGGDNSAALSALQEEKSALKQQLSAANKKLNQIAGRRGIDELNKELCEKLSIIRSVRPRFPVNHDGVLNQAISLLADTAYSQTTHDDIFQQVTDLYDTYTAQQTMIRQHDPKTGDLEKLVGDRNETKAKFCEAVRLCKEKCTELKAEARREQLNGVLRRLSELYPNFSSAAEFSGDVDEAIQRFTKWQTAEGDKVRDIQRITEQSLDSLSHHLAALQQGLVLNVNIAQSEDPEQYKLQEQTTQALAAVNKELKVTDMTKGSESHTVITSIYSALITRIGGEFSLLDNMHTQLAELQELSDSIRPWLGKTEPDDMDWLQQKERKLKELKSKLRHRLADMEDLRENDDGSDTEMTDMETQVSDVRLEIHSVLQEMEKFIENIAKLSHTVLPEIVFKYPRLKLTTVQNGEGFVKPLRDITFYKETVNSETTFNGKAVILKTLSTSVRGEKKGEGVTALPTLVRQISDAKSQLKNLVKVDAVFYSKNGVNTYVQLTSPDTRVYNYLRDCLTVNTQSIIGFISTLEIESPQTPSSPAAEEVD